MSEMRLVTRVALSELSLDDNGSQLTALLRHSSSFLSIQSAFQLWKKNNCCYYHNLDHHFQCRLLKVINLQVCTRKRHSNWSKRIYNNSKLIVMFRIIFHKDVIIDKNNVLLYLKLFTWSFKSVSKFKITLLLHHYFTSTNCYFSFLIDRQITLVGFRVF